MAVSKTSPSKLIGSRVQSARETLGWTQEQLADFMSFKDRQSISDIENGKRSIKAEELLKLGEGLNRNLDYFLDPFSVAGEAQFSWRVAPEVPEAVLDEFELRAGRVVGLLRWLRTNESGPTFPLKFNLRLPERCSFEDVQNRAEYLVNKFNLGQVPALGLVECIETNLDLRVLFIDIPDGSLISGAACHLNDLGAVLVNRNESEGRRNFDLAHEVFHALTWDSLKPGHREKDKRIERLADNFAAALLMPLASLQAIVDRERLEDTAYASELAATFRVTTQALGWRLFNLTWISDTTRAGLTYERPLRVSQPIPKRFSAELVNRLGNAIHMGHLSARKAAKILDYNLSQLEDLFLEHDSLVPFEL